MKKLFNLLFFILFFIGLTLTVFGQPAEPSEPYQVQHFTLRSGSTLEASVATGDISVIGTDDRHASVAVLVTDSEGNFNRSAVERTIKNYTIIIREEKNKLIASATRNTPAVPGEQELLISFRINVPKKTLCTVTNTGGSINLYNVRGNTMAQTTGGNLSLCKFSGKLKAETGGGTITLNEAEGSLEMNSKGGSINLKKVSGDIVARSEGGSILADVRELGKYLTLETHEGSLKVTIPGSCGLDVDLSGSQVKTDLSDFKGTSAKDKVSGSMFGGGIPVKLNAGNGVTELIYRS